MLAKVLEEFGTVFHIHSRRPPHVLTLPDRRWFRGEWFGKDTNVPKSSVVIYLFRDPVTAMLSRFSDGHLINIQVPLACHIARGGIASYSETLVKLSEFHQNYITRDPRREYPIICVNYHKLWSQREVVCRSLGIPEETPFPRYYHRSAYEIVRSNPKLLVAPNQNEEVVNRLTRVYADMQHAILTAPAVTLT